MSSDTAADLIRHALMVTVTLAGPVLLIVLLVSLLINVLQAMTQLQDPTLSTIPRLAAGGVALFWILPWLLERLMEYSTGIYTAAGLGL